MESTLQTSKLESRYQFRSLIGKGGTGEVYSAWDEQLKRTVAIKKISPNGVDDATLADPWSEAVRLAAIRHANIVTVYDIGKDNEIPYIVMEHIQGESLDDRIIKSALSITEFVDIARQLLEGLSAAHHAGLVHRDLKPSNIMLSPLPSGACQVKILDFGMAKFLETPCTQTCNIDGSITGSIAWISPEQLNRQAVDARSDLYSLGCVFYYSLSGYHPFDGKTTAEILSAHLSHNVAPLETCRPDLPPLVCQWVMALINLQPEYRYQSAIEALDALNGILPYSQTIALPVAATAAIAVTPPVKPPLPKPPLVGIPTASALAQAAPVPGNQGTSTPTAPLSTTPSERQATHWLTLAFIAVIVLLAGLLGVLGLAVFQMRSPSPIAMQAPTTPPVPKAVANTPAALPDSPKSIAAEKNPAHSAEPVATPSVAPAIAAAPSPAAAVPERVAEVIYRINGSNTIGAKLLPALMEEFLKTEGAARIQRKPGATPEDLRIEAVLSGKNEPEAIVIEAHGSKTAFEGLLAANCDLGMSSRPVKGDEASAIATAGLGDLRSASCEHVLGLDGVAVIVNKDNPVASLKKSDIAAIFSGQITDWSQLSGSAGPIRLYARDNKSGTFDTFKSLVLGSAEMNANAIRFEDSNALSDAVAADPAGIGFVGLPFVRDAKALAVSEQGTLPFIPTRFTVATEDYLLSRRLFLYTSTASRKNPMTSRFLDFALSEKGQAIVHELGFVKQTPDLQKTTPPSDAPADYVALTRETARLNLNLRFRPSSTQLDNKALRDMDRIMNLLARPDFQDKTLLLLGFTDSSGAAEKNLRLSAERAEIVAKEFALRGFTATHAQGFGSAMPVASNDTESGRDKNRRVEVWLK